MLEEQLYDYLRVITANEEVDRAQTQIKAILDKAGAAQHLIEAVCEEDTISRTRLSQLVSTYEKQVKGHLSKHLITFLRIRSYYLLSTDAGYSSFPHSPMNLVCSNLYKILQASSVEGLVLCPHLKNLEYLECETLDEFSQSISKDHVEFFCNHLFSENGQGVIQIKTWFSMLLKQDKFKWIHSYISDDNEVELSPNEITLLKQAAMPHSSIIADSAAAKLELENAQGDTFFHKLLLLTKIYASNDNGHNSSGTLDYNALSEARRVFLQFWDRLHESTKAEILDLEIFNKRFEYYFDLATKVQTEEICLAELSKNLFSFAMQNKSFLITINPDLQIPAQAPHINSLQDHLGLIEQSINYRIEKMQAYLADNSNITAGALAFKDYYRFQNHGYEKLNPCMKLYQALLGIKVISSIQTLAEVKLLQSLLTPEKFIAFFDKYPQAHTFDKLLKQIILSKDLELTQLILESSKVAPSNSHLITAMQEKNLDILRILLSSNKFNLTDFDEHGYLPVFYAAIFGSLEIMEFIYGCSSNTFPEADHLGHSLLFYAVMAQNTAVAKYLLGHHSKLTSQDHLYRFKDGSTVFTLASKQGICLHASPSKKKKAESSQASKGNSSTASLYLINIASVATKPKEQVETENENEDDILNLIHLQTNLN